MRSHRTFFLVSLFVLLVSVAARAGEVHGSIALDRKLEMKTAPTAALYVIARRMGQTAGMPLAVKRLEPPFRFPIEFALTSENVMMQGTELEGKLAITARVAQSGSATPIQAGDIETSRPAMLEAGHGQAKLLLDRIRK